MNLKKVTVWFLLLCLVLAAQGLWAGGAQEKKEAPQPMMAAAPKKGGTLHYAMIDSPPSLDQQVITSDLATTIAQHMFEGLYTFDANYAPVPLLAKGEEVKNGGKLITIQLREGVLFHNGKEMTSDDVVASLRRWGKNGVRGPVLFQHIDRVEAAGKYAVNLYFKDVFAPWKNLMAFINGGPSIYTKEVAEAAGAEPIPRSGYIGTGPYKFVEWNEGRYILLRRFDDYVSPTGPPDGYGGERVAYFDELRFIPVPDAQTRVNGLQAGDYEYAERIPGDLYETLDKDPNVITTVNEGAQMGLMFFNSKAGIMSAQGKMMDHTKLRQAILAATSMEPVLRSAIGPPALWKLNGSVMPEGTVWYSKSGIESYNQDNVEKAKRLAKEAGYNGEKIVFMATTSYQTHYDSCVVLNQQLKDAGFNIDFQVYDWATLVSRRVQPDLWDIFFTTHGFVPDPILYTFLSDNYPGWWTTPEKEQLTSQFTQTLEQARRKEIWDQIQGLVYTQVPVVKTGDMFIYNIYSPKVQGIGTTSLIWPKFWGVWYQ